MLAILVGITILIDILHLALLTLHFAGGVLIVAGGLVALITLWRLWRLTSISYRAWEHVRKLEEEKDPWYIVLGVKKTATYEEALHRFRDLCKELHPDVNPSPEANEQLMRIVEAFDEARVKTRGRRRFGGFRAQPA